MLCLDAQFATPDLGVFFTAFQVKRDLSGRGGCPKIATFQKERAQVMIDQRQLILDAACRAVALSVGMR